MLDILFFIINFESHLYTINFHYFVSDEITKHFTHMLRRNKAMEEHSLDIIHIQQRGRLYSTLIKTTTNASLYLFQSRKVILIVITTIHLVLQPPHTTIHFKHDVFRL